MASRSYLHRTMRMASLISDSWSEEKEGRWCRISQINCSFMVSSVFEDMIPDLGVISELSNNLKQTFQAGVDALYNRCVSCGATPSAKTPAAVSTAIGTIHTNRYNTGYSAGRTQGQNDVKGAPNSYGLYTQAQLNNVAVSKITITTRRWLIWSWDGRTLVDVTTIREYSRDASGNWVFTESSSGSNNFVMQDRYESGVNGTTITSHISISVSVS